MKLLWEMARRHRRRWWLGCLLLLLTNAMAMAIPHLFRRAVDILGQEGSAPELRHLALKMGLAALLGALFRTGSRIAILYAARDVELDLRRRYYAHLTCLDPAFFQTHPTGDLMSRATSDLTQVRLLLGPGVLNVVNTAVAYAVAVPLMFQISPKLTLLAFAVYPPAIWLMRQLGRQLYRANQAQQVVLGQLSSFVREHLVGAAMVRAFVLEDTQRRQFEAYSARYLEANLSLAWTRSGMFRVAMSLTNVGTLLTVCCGALDVFAGRLSLGDVVALVEYMALLAGPTFTLGWIWSLWQRGTASLARLSEVLDARPVLSAGSAAAEARAPRLQLREVGVVYGSRAVLAGVTATLEAGQLVGIVGPIGSGKTTLLRAVQRFVPLATGAIALDATPLGEFSAGSLRRRFGYVPQGPSLFSKSLADNIAFGRPDASRAEILAAAEAACLGADLQQLPAGLDTLVGERGVTLSGGQKQRVALARALLLDPAILLLDDALSAVDAQTEATLLANLRVLRRGRTTLLVAHRLSAVELADQILVLQAGRVTECGTDASLRQAAGWYAATVARQALVRDLEGEARP